MYTIEFTHAAKRQLLKLPVEIRARVLGVLERIRVRPYVFVKRLSGSKYFRVRAGKYRIIIDIIDQRLVIVVLELGKRDSIYK